MDTICNKPQKQILAIFSLLFLSFIFSINKVSAADGEKIFKQNCAVCHSLGKDKVTGPGLEGVATRVPGDAWLMKWIKNNKAVIASGDGYANKLYAENKADMTVFNDFSDDDLKAVIAYIKNPPKEIAAAPAAASGGPAAPAEEGVNPLAILL